jgi:nucleoside-diphosphate-sugar epimerase
VARILIVGCGCRGRELARTLLARGHIVRGTTRRETGELAIEQAGVEPVIADPYRLATLTPKLDGVSVLCWLLGSAVGEPEDVAAVHGPRLETLLLKLVDTHVRGVVYEGAGSAPPDLLTHGAELVRRAHETFQMPVHVVERDPADRAGWLADMTAGVDVVLS